MPNAVCNLECVKKKKPEEVVEFVGPVKIILVDQPRHAYRHKICYAAFVVLAQMVMATTFLIVAFYTLTYKKETFMKALHIFLCTIGLQLFFPMGVLSLNHLNGAAAPMKLSDRRFEHGVLQIFGLGTTIAGSVVAYFSGYPTYFSLHSYFGIAANSLALLNGLLGIIMYIITSIISKDYVHKCVNIFLCIHRIFGVLTLILSSTCFILGIIKDSFLDWLPLIEMFYSLPAFCIFYTIVVIYKPLFIKKP